MVTFPDACEILEMLSEASIKLFLDGGWGVDALIGRETRIHNDIDLFVEKKDYGKAISVSINPQAQVLFHLGYECDEKDVHDVLLLCRVFNLEIPEEYKTHI